MTLIVTPGEHITANYGALAFKSPELSVSKPTEKVVQQILRSQRHGVIPVIKIENTTSSNLFCVVRATCEGCKALPINMKAENPLYCLSHAFLAHVETIMEESSSPILSSDHPASTYLSIGISVFRLRGHGGMCIQGRGGVIELQVPPRASIDVLNILLLAFSAHLAFHAIDATAATGGGVLPAVTALISGQALVRFANNTKETHTIYVAQYPAEEHAVVRGARHAYGFRP